MYQKQSKQFETLYLYRHSLYCVDLLFHYFIFLPYLTLYVAIKLGTSTKESSKVRDRKMLALDNLMNWQWDLEPFSLPEPC